MRWFVFKSEAGFGIFRGQGAKDMWAVHQGQLLSCGGNLPAMLCASSKMRKQSCVHLRWFPEGWLQDGWISDARKVENSSRALSKNKANLWLFWNPLRRRKWGEGTAIKWDLQFNLISYDWAGEKLAEHCWNLLNQNSPSLMGKSLSLPGITHMLMRRLYFVSFQQHLWVNQEEGSLCCVVHRLSWALKIFLKSPEETKAVEGKEERRAALVIL